MSHVKVSMPYHIFKIWSKQNICLNVEKVALSHACVLLIFLVLTRVDHSYKDKQKMAVMLIITMKDASNLVSCCLHLLICSCCTPQQQYCLVRIVILSSWY